MLSDFVILDPLPPFTYSYASRVQPLSPSGGVWMWFCKDVKEINFVNYHQSKDYKQRGKIKKLKFKAVRKCWIITPRRPLGWGCFFDGAGKMWMDNFGCLNSSLSLFYFYFVTNMRKKKKYSVFTFTVTNHHAFSQTTSPPPASVLTLWITS